MSVERQAPAPLITNRDLIVSNDKFNYLIPELTDFITNQFIKKLSTYLEFRVTVDTSPLLNMSISVFVGSLINILDGIKAKTIGEVELIENIELTKSTLVKALEDLPFTKKIEFI